MMNEIEHNNENNVDALEQCRKERGEYLAACQRVRADLANARKEQEKREAEFMRFAEEGILRELLAVAVPFEHALENAEGAPEDRYREGVQQTYQQLIAFLKHHGVEGIPADPGMLLNVAYHEAVETAPAATEKEDNVIVKELEKGYTLHGKVIKASKVTVGIYKLT